MATIDSALVRGAEETITRIQREFQVESSFLELDAYLNFRNLREEYAAAQLAVKFHKLGSATTSQE